MASLRAAPQAAIPLRDLVPTLEGLVAFAASATGASGGAVYLYDDEHGDLVLAAGFGLPPAAMGHRLAVGEGLPGLAAGEGRSVASHDVAFDLRARPRRPDWDADPPVRAFLGFPLRTGTVIVGVLELTSPRTDAFSPEARGRVALFADAAGLLIEETRLRSLAAPPDVVSAPRVRDPLGLATLDDRLHVATASPALCHLLGEPLEAIVSRPIFAVIPALASPAARDGLQAALHGAPGNLGSVTTTTSDGDQATLSVSALPIGGSGSGLMLVALDVTERARLEAELRARHSQAAEARDRLRNVVEVVSHELRTPLTSILGFAQLLEERPDAPDEQRRRWAEVVADKARLMARLVGEITDLARLGSDRFALNLGPVDVPDLVRRVANDMESGLSARRVLVTAADTPLITADPERLEQVVVNLLTNALKFSPADEAVEVAVSGDTGGVAIEVADRGPGIPTSERELVFTAFYRSPSVPESVGGTGLGLAVSKGIVDAHGGEIAVMDRAGGGTIVRVTLPYSGIRVDDGAQRATQA
jgi:signal transduction histidine kinase